MTEAKNDEIADAVQPALVSTCAVCTGVTCVASLDVQLLFEDKWMNRIQAEQHRSLQTDATVDNLANDDDTELDRSLTALSTTSTDILLDSTPTIVSMARIPVQRVDECIRKPFLGGYISRLTHAEYHHASTQTPPPAHKVEELNRVRYLSTKFRQSLAHILAP